MTNDRGPQGDGIQVRVKLTDVLGLTVEILCIGDILLGVHAFTAGKYAIGADMNQARTGQRAQLGNTMGQHGIDRECGKRIFGIGQLFDEPDAVDDDIRLDPCQHRNQRVLVKHVDIADQRTVHVLRKVSCATRIAQSAPHLVVRVSMELPEHCATQHSGDP
ncbi:hypothetical protein D9M69_399820 [compost metagenome]